MTDDDIDRGPIDLNSDVIIACADLVGRTGADGFDIGYSEHAPVTWHAVAVYQGARIRSEGHASPTTAALGLAERLLRGATCRCGKTVTLSSARAFAGTLEGCRWRLVGNRWEPGCDAPPMSREQAEKIRKDQHGRQ